MNLEKISAVFQNCAGLEEAELVLKNARIVNVLRKRLSAETLPFRTES